MTIKFDIRNRWSGEVQFTAEIDADENTHWRIKIGLAARWAFANKVSLRGADLSGADLSGADLRGADLRSADMSSADMSSADMSSAVLSGAVLRAADLSGAVLSGAVLSGAALSGAVLRGADLSGADLSGAVLSGAVLRGADLSGAVLSGAVLSEYKIIRRLAAAMRNDGYEFIAFETDKGVIIRAGCRTFSPERYRDHVARTYPDTDKAEETLAIITFIEQRAKALGVK
jgi:hypothetical protein